MGSGAAEELPVTWAARTERTDGKTSPEKLAAAAHSACYAMALALRLGERKAVPQRLAITATVTLDETRALTMTFNPDAMDLRPCRRSALLTRRVVGE